MTDISTCTCIMIDNSHFKVYWCVCIMLKHRNTYVFFVLWSSKYKSWYVPSLPSAPGPSNSFTYSGFLIIYSDYLCSFHHVIVFFVPFCLLLHIGFVSFFHGSLDMHKEFMFIYSVWGCIIDLYSYTDSVKIK